MDEDLRDAIEILVSECSCYTPFRAFLMDGVQADFAFMPNKLEPVSYTHLDVYKRQNHTEI